jgi:hypothetical protein
LYCTCVLANFCIVWNTFPSTEFDSMSTTNGLISLDGQYIPSSQPGHAFCRAIHSC